MSGAAAKACSGGLKNVDMKAHAFVPGGTMLACLVRAPGSLRDAGGRRARKKEWSEGTQVDELAAAGRKLDQARLPEPNGGSREDTGEAEEGKIHCFLTWYPHD